MFFEVFIFVVGLTLLYFGAEWLVGGASSMALRLGITPLIVGCTVVAFGTSAPELVVSLAAVVTESDDISVGNIIGSNVANLALILGTASIIKPMQVRSSIIKREFPVMLGATMLLVGLCYDGELSRIDGAILLTGMVAYIGYMIVIARMEMARGEDVEFEELEGIDPEAANPALDITKIVLGIVGLAAGAQLMVSSATTIAEHFGVPQLIIGITVVAIGTSLPELATSIIAAMKEEADISVGNVVGSNVFNCLLVLGSVAVIAGVSVGADAITYDLWIMLGVTIAVWPIMWTGRQIGRLEGAILVTFYFGYMIWLFLR